MKTVRLSSYFRNSLFLAVMVASTVLCGCSIFGSKNASSDNPVTKIGERYQAPTTKSNPREIDLAEVGKLNLKLASAYYAAGQYQTAYEMSAIAVEALPNDVNALGMAALIQVELRNKTKAQEYFDRAFKIAPKDADLNHNYGAYLCRTEGGGDPVRAMEYFKAALAVEGYSKPASTLSAGADCLVKLGRDEEAIQFYTGALRFEPMNRFSLMGLADLQYHRGSTRDALELTNRYVRVAQSNPESLWLQLRIAKKLGMTQDEKGYAADLRRTYPASRQTQLLEEGKFD